MPGRGDRQAFAAKLGFSETVFVDDPERGVIDIYTPSAAAALRRTPLRRRGLAARRARTRHARGRGGRPAGRRVQLDRGPRRSGRRRARCGGTPRPPRSTRWRCRRRGSGSTPGPGRTRPRAASGPARFPGRGDGIDEDEATGAAALLLTAQLGRALNITQGTGSQLLTAPSRRAGWRSAAGCSWNDERQGRSRASRAAGTARQPPLTRTQRPAPRTRPRAERSRTEAELLPQGNKDRGVQRERALALVDDPLLLQVVRRAPRPAARGTPA